MALPNFLICGAYKSGTTSLYYYLKGHPDIFIQIPDALDNPFNANCFQNKYNGHAHPKGGYSS